MTKHSPLQPISDCFDSITRDGLDDSQNITNPPGAEHPALLLPEDDLTPIPRSFAFLDLANFTSFTASNGDLAAVELLTLFRAMVKEVAARRRVRIAKWLGDGVLIIGIRPAPLLATVAELMGRFGDSDISARAGLATGPVIIFDGDDYIGQPINLAARLEAEALPGEILADSPTASAAPDWIVCQAHKELIIRGLEEPLLVHCLSMAPLTHLPEVDLVSSLTQDQASQD